MAGFHFCHRDVVVCLDDDGETPPEKMFLLIDKLEEGYDLVSAKYKEEKAKFLFGKSEQKSVLQCPVTLSESRRTLILNSFYVFSKLHRKGNHKL